MTRKRSGARPLPAAEIDEGVLRTLEQAIPPRWQPVVTWWAVRPSLKNQHAAVRPSLEIQHANLQDLIDEISQEERIDEVGFSIFENPVEPEAEVYFQLWCDSDGCALEYRSPDDEEVWGALSRFEQTVAGILRNQRRLPWFRAARIRLGKAAMTPRSQLLNWRGVSRSVIAGIISGVVVGIIMLFIGIAID